MKRISLVIILVMILIGGVYWYTEYTNNSKFIQACKDLNGKELTVKNLQDVSNRIYFLSEKPSNIGGVEPIQQYHIDQYMAFLNKNEKPKATTTHNVTIVDNNITLSEGELDDTWRCNIRADGNKIIISTESYYQPD